MPHPKSTSYANHARAGTSLWQGATRTGLSSPNSRRPEQGVRRRLHVKKIGRGVWPRPILTVTVCAVCPWPLRVSAPGFFLCRVDTGISSEDDRVHRRVSSDPVCVMDAAGDLACRVQPRDDLAFAVYDLAGDPFRVDASHCVMHAGLCWARIEGTDADGLLGSCCRDGITGRGFGRQSVYS